MAKINPNANVVAYILAGGESRRFNCQIKGLQRLQNKPLIQHVITRLEPQVSTININSHFDEYAQFGFPLVPDFNDKFMGPLAGLLASMQHLNTYHPEIEWLMIVPCDSPLLPHDLVFHLSQNSDHYQACCIEYQKQLQPPFSLWHKSLIEKLEDAVMHKQWGGLKAFINSLEHKVNIIEYPEQDNDPFININSSDDLQQLEHFLS